MILASKRSSAIVIILFGVYSSLLDLLDHVKAAQSDEVGCGTLLVKSGCLCPGSTVVYECAVNGSTEGLTVWQATGCNQDIILHHNDFVNKSGPGCQNVHGKGISISGSCYVSRMTIENVSSSNIDGNVTCSLDAGSTTIVGRRSLSVPTGYALAINNLHRTVSPPGELSFTWDRLTITDCPSLHYMIAATEGCGSCPVSVSDNDITCRNVKKGKDCTLSVYVNLCGNRIQSDTKTVSTGRLPMITNLRRHNDGSSEGLTLTWDLVNATYCPSVDYVINTTIEGCGMCSVSEVENTATCRDVKRRGTCTYFIFVNICGDSIRNETNIILTAGSSGGIPTGIIIGITLGGIVAVVMVIATIAAVVVCMWYRHKHYHKRDLDNSCERQLQDITITSAGSNETKPEEQGAIVGTDDESTLNDSAIINPSSSEDKNKGQATNTIDDKCQPISRESLKFQSGQLENDEIIPDSCDSPGTFGRFYKRLSSLAISNRLKETFLGEPTIITVLLKENRDRSDLHIPVVSGELLSDSENAPIQCKVNEIVRNKRYKIEFTPTVRGQHQLHIKEDNEHIEGSPYTVLVKLPVHMLGTPVAAIGDHKINEPCGLTVNDNGEILVVEEGRQCVSIYHPDGTNLRSFGSPSIMGSQILSKPRGVAVRDDGTILVVDSGKHCISVFTSEGDFKESVGTLGSDPLQFNEPMGIGIHPSTKHVYVTEFLNNRIQVLSSDLKQHIGTFGSKGSEHGQFIQPWDVSFDSKGDVYIADSGNHRIQIFEYDTKNVAWNFLRKIGEKGRKEGQLMWPSSIFIDHENYVYVTEDDNYRISIYTNLGKFVKSFGKKGDSLGEFDLPHGIVIDKNGYIYVSDHKNNRLQVF